MVCLHSHRFNLKKHLDIVRILKQKKEDLKQIHYARKSQRVSKNNYGVLDVDVVSSIRSNVKCPGYRQYKTDLNSLADGSQISLCEIWFWR